MRALLFVPDMDTPGKRDMSAAFLPAAQGFAKAQGINFANALRRFPAHAPLDQRRAVCSMALGAASNLDVVAYFCHGWKGGVQAGYLRAHTLMLARLLAKVARVDAHVLFYACSTGADLDLDGADEREPGPGGDGGFADNVRDACDVLGRRITVTGHTTEGHTTDNPFARYFAPQCGGKGGHWFVEPRSALWPLWVAALKDPKNTLRYRFWAMTPQAIEAELRGLPGPLVA